MKTDLTFVIANVTGTSSVDVIAFQDRFEFEAFKGYAAQARMSWIVTTEEDACKLLIAADGIGCGCYTMIGAEEPERAFRKALAQVRKHDIAAFTGFIVMHEPLELKLVATLVKESSLLPPHVGGNSPGLSLDDCVVC